MTIKPGGFAIKVRRREGRSINVGLSGGGHADTQMAVHSEDAAPGDSGKPITILYGSNAGTCRAYAEELAAEAHSFGFSPTINTLDSATEQVPKEVPDVIIVPSYEGKPPDNAKKFVAWLEAHADEESILVGRSYAVFGVGNSEWASTFHRIPKLVYSLMTKLGAKAITPAGFADVKIDPIGPWESWRENLWTHLRGDSQQAAQQSKGLSAEISPAGSVKILGGDEMAHGIVKENRGLGGGEVGPAKKHMEIELPEDVSFRTGE